MSDFWRDQLFQAVTPLANGVRHLQVSNFRAGVEDESRPGRTAAVLVPILDGEHPEIVFTRRAEHLSHHPGQVSFPGGAAEAGDNSAVDTALRESFEEIGLQAAAVTPLGFLDRFDTVSDYRVLPVVGLVNKPREWIIDYAEVAEVFTVPLHIALDISRYQKQVIRRQGRKVTLHSLDYDGHNIWGLTAAMLLNLSLRMGRS